MKKKFRFLFLLFLTAFLLNLLWENLQMPWYTPAIPFAVHFPMCFRASLFDASYITGMFLVLAGINKDFFWIQKMSRWDVALIVIACVTAAIFIEMHALATGRWGYTESMPRLPFFGAGLLPVLQLPVLSLTTYWFVKSTNNDR